MTTSLQPTPHDGAQPDERSEAIIRLECALASRGEGLAYMEIEDHNKGLWLHIDAGGIEVFLRSDSALNPRRNGIRINPSELMDMPYIETKEIVLICEAIENGAMGRAVPYDPRDLTPGGLERYAGLRVARNFPEYQDNRKVVPGVRSGCRYPTARNPDPYSHP